MREALREFGLDPARIPRSRARRARCSRTPSCTSSRGRCSRPRACRSAWSRDQRLLAPARDAARRGGARGHGADEPAPRRARRRCGMRSCRRENRRQGHAELVGTVGRIEAKPGAINVIPGEVPSRSTCARRRIRSESMPSRRSLARSSTHRKEDMDCEIESLQEFGPRRARRASWSRWSARSSARGCRCAACPPAPATTAWRSPRSPESACCSCAARAGSATARSKRLPRRTPPPAPECCWTSLSTSGLPA